MRIEVLSYLVLRLVVGSYMIGHAIVNVVTYRSYSEKIELFQSGHNIFNNEFFFIAAPLFPFLEFFIGLLIIVSFYYRRALIAGLTMYIIASVVYCYAGAHLGRNIIYVALLVMTYLLLRMNCNHYNTPHSHLN
ncbi:hypothetical protein EAX61_06395 [Dokdonia sinensis]|uniref:DoxX family protein n=1 Tax=Dokdonia sinensis TaxID=2479847 RepID=A0A3M0G7J0_9FLAO|nr:hypothetical protein EAX61_06395 [Dokdonia sinensis]